MIHRRAPSESGLKGQLPIAESNPVQLALDNAFVGGSVHVDPSALRTVVVGAGELLCDVGEPATTAWVLVSGRVQASTVEPDGSEQPFQVQGPGELIGEAAFLDEGPRRARVRTLRRSQLVELDRVWLIELLSKQPELAMSVVRTVVELGDRPAEPPTGVVAIIALDSSVADEARLVAEAAAHSGGHVMIAADDIADHQLLGAVDGFDWLDDAEREHGGVVLLGDPTSSSRAVAVAEVADRVVFVVDAEHGPSVGELERKVVRSIPRRANAARLLLLVHPTDTDRPRNTREWLDRRDIDRHLHLRRETRTDQYRAARHAIGRPLTLAIGAGGVRSAGAVGTVRALAKRGIAVDAAAGVSGGAIIASWLAIATSLDDLADKTEWSMRKLLDYTLPVGAVIAGKRAWGRIQEAVGDCDIADTWLPLSIVSTDLTDGVPVNHTRGSMADALYASISVPGVFPPVDIDGHLHVDGAVFDAIPVEAARELVPEGPMVVVDLTPPHGRATGPLPRVMSGTRLLLRRLLPGVQSPSVPNPLDTLMRTTTVASAGRRVDALDTVSCHVHLNLSEFSVLEFDKVRRIIAIGETRSEDPLDDSLAGEVPPITDPDLMEALEPIAHEEVQARA